MGMKIIGAFVLLIAVNIAAHKFHVRFDLTEDQRYTLSKEAIATVSRFETPIIIDILLDGSLSPEFARLQDETLQLLEEFRSENHRIQYNLVNPLEGDVNSQQVISELQQIGLSPANVTTKENGKVSQEYVFPWAMVNSGNQTVKVALLKNKLGTNTNTEERINNSVQQLEYAFADAFTKLGIREKKRIAVIKGNGELDDRYIADYLSSIRDYYNIGAFTLDSVASDPQQTLDGLQQFDLALIAKPTEAFTEQEKYVLDQFIMNGGKSIWLMDQVIMELDSLFNDKGRGFATPRDVNLNDFFFRYGVRINPVLINDLYNTPIVLATGEANNSEYNPLPWVYHPMVFSRNDHPINNNIEAVRMQFANAMDTLSNTSRKTVLLWSSPLSQTEGTPKEIKLSSISKERQPAMYANKGNHPLAVLIEGAFKSSYTNRVKPFKANAPIEVGVENKMIVIADGDLIKNQLRNGRPLELGYDKWTNSFYGNKEFLVNSTNYLLDDTGLINIRTKKVAIPLLDPQKIIQKKQQWQFITIGLPIALIFVMGFVFNFYRKRRFSA